MIKTEEKKRSKIHMNGNLIRCQNGHLFSARRYGTVCPYCNIETATQEKRETGRDSEEVLE